MSGHLVERVHDAVHRLLVEMLAESVGQSLQGAEKVDLTRTVILYETNDPRVRAELAITLALKVSDRS